MRRRQFALAAAFAFTLFCLTASLPSPAAPPTQPFTQSSALPAPILPDGLGVNIHFTDAQPGEMKMLAAAGFSRVRMDFSWEGTEHQQGRYDFAPYDRLMKALGDYRIKPVFILDYKNKLYDDGLSPHTDEGRTAFARWAAAAATHFQNSGVIWEMYNEPNIGFWKPKPDADAYARLALAVGKALREAAPGETYVGPATSLIDFKFLETCFKAGCLEYWSAVSVHPYRQNDPETVIDEYRRLRLLIARYAPRGKTIPILSGEWGYSSAWKKFDPDRQGKYLPRQWLTNVSNDVPLSIWYDWHDDGADPREAEHHFGIVAHEYHAPEKGREPEREAVYDPKPAYVAARTLTTFLKGYRFNKRLIVGDAAEDFVLLFNKEGDVKQVKLAAWTTAHGPHTLRLSASPGVFHATDHLGKALPDLTATQGQGLVIAGTDGVQYLEPEKPNDLLGLAAAWERAQLEIVSQGGRVIDVRTGGTNPLKAPQTLALDSSLRPKRESSWADEVRPGERFAGDYRLLIRREEGPVDFELQVRGPQGDNDWKFYSQRSRVVVEDPLSATFLPPTGGSLLVRMENPSGRPFRGNLEVREGSSRDVARKEIRFAEGEKTLSVQVPTTLTGRREYEVAYRLLEVVDGRETAVLRGDASYQSADDFNRYAAGGLDKSWKLSADGDVEIGAKLHLAAAAPPDGPPVPGAGVLELRYHFEPGWKFMQLLPQADEIRNVRGAPAELGLWVYGDGQGNLVRMRFTDARGQTFQPKPRFGDKGAEVDKVDWTGWRYLTFPLNGENAYHWGGTEDGVINYPIHLDSLFLLDSANRHETEGAVYLAAPTFVDTFRPEPF